MCMRTRARARVRVLMNSDLCSVCVMFVGEIWFSGEVVEIADS